MKQVIQDLLDLADVKINGHRSWDIQVHNSKLYERILAKGTMGLGEAYMDGWWDCKAIDELITIVLKAKLDQKIKKSKHIMWNVFKAKTLNLQSHSRSYKTGGKHYDIGNDLYVHMLDKRMVYTCAYWKNAKNLDDAQEAKLDLICKKIGLKPDMKVLDIGCGWGSFAKYAAEKYGAHVVGITVSKEQVKLGNELCKGLPVEIHLQDYREVQEKFDRIVSLGMIEHVGYKNFRTYMEVAHRCLKSDGLFLLHTIGGNKSVYSIDPWIDKYIFPDSMLPSAKQLTSAAEGLFVLEDWHNFGLDYDKTLMAWYENFNANWEKLKDAYDQRFYRMWKYYLLSSAGGFRVRKNQLWQIVFSKNGVEGGYTSIR